MLFLALVDVSAEYSTASSLRGRSYEHRHINSQGILCHGPGAPDVELHARLAREPFLTEDCRRMLSSFLLRFPDASTEAAINEVHRWLVGRVVAAARQLREFAPGGSIRGVIFDATWGRFSVGAATDTLVEYTRYHPPALQPSVPCLELTRIGGVALTSKRSEALCFGGLPPRFSARNRSFPHDDADEAVASGQEGRGIWTGRINEGEGGPSLEQVKRQQGRPGGPCSLREQAGGYPVSSVEALELTAPSPPSLPPFGAPIASFATAAPPVIAAVATSAPSSAELPQLQICRSIPAFKSPQCTGMFTPQGPILAFCPACTEVVALAAMYAIRLSGDLRK